MRTGLALIGGGLAVAQFLSGAITSDVLATGDQLPDGGIAPAATGNAILFEEA